MNVPAALGGRGASIRLDGLCKVFADAVAVADLSLEVGAGEFLTLLGPSGSGKSTTLLMIAGFLVPTRGDVFIGGVPVTRKPPHERDIGCPCDVGEGYVPGYTRLGKLAEVRSRVDQIIE